MISGMLPIGTVVSLADIVQKVMIVGFLPIDVNDPDVQHEYAGMAYPLGYRSADEIVQFDSDMITEIHFIGMINTEQMEFEQFVADKLAEEEEDEDDDSSDDEEE